MASNRLTSSSGISPNRDMRSKSQKIIREEIYIEKASLPVGKLPVQKTIIEAMMYLLRAERASQAQRSVTDAARILAYVLIEHWMFCNIYTQRMKAVTQSIEKLYKEFIRNVQTRVERRNEQWKIYNQRVKVTLFDISAKDERRRKILERETGIKMLEIEEKFLNDQRGPRIGYCDDFVDRQWSKTMKRKKFEMEIQDRLKQKDKCDQETVQKRISWNDVIDDEMQTDDSAEMGTSLNVDSDAEYEPDENDDGENNRKRFRRHVY
ncbi:uncharacterized protein LOC121385857 [Gigantopelta aegis]|uniref:uncharacterized protein LOC121385857 n=1 Tax=Gigantopelta aegis TaxID=1735272 RepID=UPI001B88E1E2|nr:uncharacterized protein LOC121385857 [Gigantopelta aegis]